MELHPEYDTFIQDFKKSYADLVVYCAKKLKVSLTIPWKVHILAVHVPQFLEQRPNFGLGVYAEQVVESSHSRMKPTLTRFKWMKLSGQKRLWSTFPAETFKYFVNNSGFLNSSLKNRFI